MLRPLLYAVASTVTRPVASQRTNKLFQGASAPTKLIIGASTTRFPGWVSTDISPRARYYLDATKPWPVRPNSLELVYADNMIEHVTLAGARETLRNAFSALRPGGKIRLVTPDIERTARIYLEPSELRAKVLARAKHDNGAPGVYPIDLLRLVMTQAGHNLGQMWDYEALSAEMLKAGFVNVHREEMGQSGVREFVGLEVRDMDPAVTSVTLVIEAEKLSAGSIAA